MRRLCIILILFGLFQTGFAQLSGPLSGVLGPGEYHVIDTISVESGDTLLIKPGTTLYFDGPFPFWIYGTLLANGNVRDSIVFTADIEANPSRWRGIRFYYESSSGSRMGYCLVENGYALGGEGNPKGAGGGVSCWEGSSPTFMHCTFTNNRADWSGGGVACDNSSPWFIKCKMISNGGTWAGGVFCDHGASPTFSECIISDNATADDGGGVHCKISTPIFDQCIISRNSSGDRGGGFRCWGDGSAATLTNCIISDNSSHDIGGGVYSDAGASSTFIHCNIIGNSARTGAGVYCLVASPKFQNTIIAFSNGEGIYFGESPETRVEYCDIFRNTDGAFGGHIPAGLGRIVMNNANGDPCDVYHNIFRSPTFVDAMEGDYHLADSSRCIGAGDPVNPSEFDIEGNQRPDPYGSNPDIGAYENPRGTPLDLDVSVGSDALLSTFALYPNWPNPFNPTTTIRYDVQSAGLVRLAIFNLLGQEVTRLVDGRHLAGSYTVAWNAADFPSGIYLCRMEAAGFVQARKMIYVK
ncbi:right-handed parallel beta-helix repeat-containing protein [bacterium]|nr:right-handed parallel beta-helix repeat-containing protein [bacterium]